ncbi:MAG: NAD/NADP-dependent betaine aldehyde dehydrogenase [Chroococcidiopsis cubana SAG 39.79]|nr:NAD/NADP-dependent betaine aldehyde dehydrogenase [Chroococcidiopsis cubana SAG 39.79]
MRFGLSLLFGERAKRVQRNVSVGTKMPPFRHYQPLGIILAVMPWNFPFNPSLSASPPALMAGNVGLLKHTSNVPQCALAIEGSLKRQDCLQESSNFTSIGSQRVAAIIADPRVKAATLTGSEPAGSGLLTAAGKQIKKTVLGLGKRSIYCHAECRHRSGC